MAEGRIAAAEMDDLIQKLDAFGAGLTDEQRSFLGGVLARGSAPVEDVEGYDSSAPLNMFSSYVGTSVQWGDVAAPRDVATGHASGKRQWEP